MNSTEFALLFIWISVLGLFFFISDHRNRIKRLEEKMSYCQPQQLNKWQYAYDTTGPYDDRDDSKWPLREVDPEIDAEEG